MSRETRYPFLEGGRRRASPPGRIREHPGSRAKRVNGAYVTDDLRERSNDVIWRVRVEESWVYICLMIEFQSSVERYMTVRMLEYLGLLYQDLIRTHQLGPSGRLPPVLPIVLYNGQRRWNAPETLEALVEPAHEALAAYRPQLRYLLLDETRYTERELVELRNLVADLFRLEQCRSGLQLERALQALIERLSPPERQALRETFEEWFRRVILPRLPEGGRIAGATSLMEMSTMLVDRMYEWAEEAEQRGREEGRQEGRQEGESQLLLRLLRIRFGDLPGWVAQRLRQAPPERLEQWGVRLLSASSLESLFEGN